MVWRCNCDPPTRSCPLLARVGLGHFADIGIQDDLAGVQEGATVKRLKYRQGSTVRVQLYDGRVVVATVCTMDDTVAGPKVRIRFGDCVHYVNADQIIAVISFTPMKQPTTAQKKKLLLAFFAEFERVMKEGG
jgi:hypothetical protein